MRVCALDKLGKQDVIAILAEKLDMTKVKAADTLNVLLTVIQEEVGRSRETVLLCVELDRRAMATCPVETDGIS